MHEAIVAAVPAGVVTIVLIPQSCANAMAAMAASTYTVCIVGLLGWL